jgi:hypothetical protein
MRGAATPAIASSAASGWAWVMFMAAIPAAMVTARPPFFMASSAGDSGPAAAKCRPIGIFPTEARSLAAMVAPEPSDAVPTAAGTWTPDGKPAGTLRPIAEPTSAEVASLHSPAAVEPMPV